jgi:hypothetical protein
MQWHISDNVVVVVLVFDVFVKMGDANMRLWWCLNCLQCRFNDGVLLHIFKFS